MHSMEIKSWWGMAMAYSLSPLILSLSLIYKKKKQEFQRFKDGMLEASFLSKHPCTSEVPFVVSITRHKEMARGFLPTFYSMGSSSIDPPPPVVPEKGSFRGQCHWTPSRHPSRPRLKQHLWPNELETSRYRKKS